MTDAAAYVDPPHADFHFQIHLALPPYYLGPCGKQATTIPRQNFSKKR